MVAVEQKRERGGPLIARKVVKAFDFSGGGAVDEKAEDLVDAEWVVDGLRLVVGLAHDDHAGTLFGVEEAFHGGDGGGLVFGHVLAVEVACGEDLKDARDDARDDAEAEEDVAVRAFALLEEVERADCGHDEGSGDDGGTHVMRVLQPSPGVHE